MNDKFHNQQTPNYFGCNNSFGDNFKLSEKDLKDIAKYKRQHENAKSEKQYAYDEKGNKIEMTEQFLPPFTV
jgi:hypothetical protein